MTERVTQGSVPCNCRANSEPDGGDPEAVLDQARHFPDTGKPRVAVDRCIADSIEMLWAAGIRTRACCCGHNSRPPSVTLDNAYAVPRAAELLRQDGRGWRIEVYA